MGSATSPTDQRCKLAVLAERARSRLLLEKALDDPAAKVLYIKNGRSPTLTSKLRPGSDGALAAACATAQALQQGCAFVVGKVEVQQASRPGEAGLRAESKRVTGSPA